MTAPAAASPAFDQAKADAFVGKVFGDTVSVASVAMARIGDQLGLFKDLATHGPSTSADLRKRTGTQERCVREWLGGMASAGYLTYDGSSGRFHLPAEYAPVLAQEGAPPSSAESTKNCSAAWVSSIAFPTRSPAVEAFPGPTIPKACITESSDSRAGGSTTSSSSSGSPRFPRFRLA